MQQGVRLVDLINPLLKILKDREELYFQLLTFVNKNIDSSSIDLDHTTIINRFLPPLRAAHQTLLSREKQLLGSLSEVSEEGKVAKGASKEMIRFSSRVMQLLEASINRVRKGIFDQNGRSDREYVRFKVNLHRILKKQPFDLSQFAESLVNYVTGKFQRQLGKVQKYLQKTWEGQDILLRQLYMKGSDLEGSSSPQQKTEKKQKKEPPTLKKQQLKLNIESHANQQDEKKVRRPLKSSLKRKQKPTVRKKVKQSPRPQQSDQQQPRKVLNKQQTANKLLKFYGLLQLSRKEFLQDYMFQNIEQQKHKNELMNKLLERNKVINSQINTYIRKSATHISVPLIIMPPPSKSSGDQKNQKNESQIAKLTGRASFVITRRRGSFHAQTSVLEPHSDHPPEFYYEDNAIKNLLPTRKKSSHSHQKPHQKSRKLYIVKQPMVFEDQVIPQAQVTKTQWLQAPLSLKKDKRNQNVRLKRKHNPTPLQNADLSQNFRYPS